MVSHERRKCHQPATGGILVSVVHGEHLLFIDIIKIKTQLVASVDLKPPAHWHFFCFLPQGFSVFVFSCKWKLIWTYSLSWVFLGVIYIKDFFFLSLNSSGNKYSTISTLSEKSLLKKYFLLRNLLFLLFYLCFSKAEETSSKNET